MSESRSHQSASRVAQSRRSVPKIGTTIAPTIGNSMEGASPERAERGRRSGERSERRHRKKQSELTAKL